ncbi:hypothetical protein BX600DRAFT_289621 [Xylariales sp. PMI_506]|nr:hypothetical protein BX600DRAFT_289621 [Xylariales sp. PMI_506]
MVLRMWWWHGQFSVSWLDLTLSDCLFAAPTTYWPLVTISFPWWGWNVSGLPNAPTGRLFRLKVYYCDHDFQVFFTFLIIISDI